MNKEVVIYVGASWGKTTSLLSRIHRAAVEAGKDVIVMPPHFKPPATASEILVLKPMPPMITESLVANLRALKTTPRQRAMPNQPFYAPFVKRGRRSF